MAANLNYSASVPVPVVLQLAQDQVAFLDRIAGKYGMTTSEASTHMTMFALHALSQIGDMAGAGVLPSALLHRLELHDSLTHRLGVSLAESERLTLLAEALLIESRHILARLNPKAQP